MKKMGLLMLLVLISSLGFADPAAHVNLMGEVIEEISVLNLLRGIYLNEDQAREIAKLAKEAEDIRNKSLLEIQALNTMPFLEQLREELFTALAEAPPAIREKVVELDDRAHEITGTALDRIARLEDEVKKVMSQGQLKIFMEFVPCIVPEYDLENPVRTGQAAASSRLMPAVELIRNTEESVWHDHGQDYLNHILKITEQEVGKFTDEVREDLRRRLVKHAWKIRRMSEADYQIHREKLAGDMLLVNREHTLRSGFRTTGKISRFLLSPAAARILPRWVEIHFDKKLPAAGSQVPRPDVPDKVDVDEVEESRLETEKKSLEKMGDAGRKFWETDVPASIELLAETPYVNNFYAAFGKPYVNTFFDEDNKYFDVYYLINEAQALLTRKKGLKFHSLTQGEP